MQGRVILRSFGVLSLIALVAGCHASTRSAAGQTPQPSQTTMAQANSTAAPAQHLSTTPGAKFSAEAAPGTHGVTFSVWANGTPVNVYFTPGKAVDITQDMRGHANVLVIQWTRTANNGTGHFAIHSQHQTVLTASVTPSSPKTGKVSKTIIAPQAPVSR
jgi:hypothetical protein